MRDKTSLINTKKKFQNWAWRQGMKFNTKVHDLNYFFWETTLRCNLNCRHCGSDCAKDMKFEELPAEKVLKVFRDIAQTYNAKEIMVAVTGGEPLVREDLFEVLKEISGMGFDWGMVTNGMLVTEAIVSKCADAGMKTVSVSLDGIASSHNWLRNNEHSYDRAINALSLFENSGRFKVVEAITCVNPENIGHLEEMYTILNSMGIKAWRLFTIFPKGRAEISRDLIFDRAVLIRMFNFIKEKRKCSPHMHISYSEEGYLGCDWEREVRDDFFFCGAGINVGGLLADGSYSACPSLSREWIQGHIDESSFPEAWEKRYKNMRDRSWMKSKACSNCKQWKNCNGSSLHLWDWEANRSKVCHFKMLNIEVLK